MEVTKITFQADEQNLVKTSGVDVFASDTVSYIEADFSLGTNWQGYDSVRAMWKFGTDVYSTVLDHDGKCIVPWEVLTKRGELKVNLVGSISENGELTDRLTTFPIVALIISKIAQVEGDNSTPPTPSEYEQFVETVKADADRAEEAEAGAEAAQIAAESARDEASQSASQALDYADSAQNAKNLAVQAKDYAIQQAQNAQQARYDAEQARNDAQAAERNAEGFAERAETAQGLAEQAAQDAEQSASRIEGLIPTPTEDGKILVTNDGEYEISELVTLTENDHLYGAENTVTRPEGESFVVDVIGNNNTLDGSSARNRMFGADVVIGDGNEVKGETVLSVISGHYNDIDGAYAGTIFGMQNKVKVPEGGLNQAYPTIVGSNNEVLPPSGEWYNDVTIVGNANKAGKRGQTIIGIYNEKIDDPKAIIVGDGTGENARHNAVVIKQTNDEYSAKLNDTEITESKLRELKAVMLPTDTASGSIASFPDGADDIPMSSVKADINPIQDLHGQGVPYPAGGSANKWDEEWVEGTINVSNGYESVTDNAIRSKNLSPCIPNTDYYVFCGAGNAQWYLGICFYDADGQFISGSYKNRMTVTSPANAAFFKITTNTSGNVYGTTYNNDISINYPSTDTSYHPYSNICPISGTTEVVVTRAGKNLLNADEIVQGDFSGYVSANTCCSGYIAVKSGGTFTMSPMSNISGRYFRFYDETKTEIDSSTRIANYSRNAITFTVPSWARYVRTNWYYNGGITPTTIKNANQQIEAGTTATTYEPYISPLTITTALGQTVYGGTVDVVSGVLTVDRAMVEYDGSNDEDWSMLGSGSASSYCMRIKANNVKQLSTSIVAISNYLPSILGSATWGNYDNFISVISTSNYIFTGMRSITSVPEWKTYLASNPLEVVYELATPITIQLTPQEVTSLLGGNTVWADSGNVEVTYKADIQRYIDKKISAVLNA